MEDFDYLSIADFAATVGVSKQAVYKRVDKDLAPFSKVINGKKYISTEAAELFNSKQQEINLDETQEEGQGKDSLTYLLSQLEEKDKIIQQQQSTISEQSTQIKELHQHIMAQSSAITEILQKQSQLQENFQVLLGRQQQALEANSTVEVAEVVGQPIEQHGAQNIESTSPDQEDSENKGFFNWFFNRKR